MTGNGNCSGKPAAQFASILDNNCCAALNICHERDFVVSAFLFDTLHTVDIIGIIDANFNISNASLRAVNIERNEMIDCNGSERNIT